MIHTVAHRGVMFVTLNNPATRNALNDAMLAGMRDALERVAADRPIRALVLVDEVAPDAAGLRACAQRWLGEMGRSEPGAVRATKRILALARRTSLGDTLDHAAYEFAASLRSGTAAEGIAALSARRQAAWSADFPDWPDLP